MQRASLLDYTRADRRRGVVANAVCDALGVELNELPLPPERVREGASR